MEIDNKFTVMGIDVASFDYPDVKVASWSSLFGGNDNSIGHMSVEAKVQDRDIELYREAVYQDTDQSELRQELQTMADEWNEDKVNNWKYELKRCFAGVIAYEEKELAKYDERKAKLENYRKNLELLNN